MNKPKPKFTDEELKNMYDIFGALDRALLIHLLGDKAENISIGHIYVKLYTYFNGDITKKHKKLWKLP